MRDRISLRLSGSFCKVEEKWREVQEAASCLCTLPQSVLLQGYFWKVFSVSSQPRCNYTSTSFINRLFDSHAETLSDMYFYVKTERLTHSMIFNLSRTKYVLNDASVSCLKFSVTYLPPYTSCRRVTILF